MKRLLSLLGACLFFSGSPSQAVTTVEHVDLTRYVGQWHEVASMPQWFQKKCVRGVTAEYSVLPNGRIQVNNSCIQADGTKTSTLGEAKVLDPVSNARLRVSFAQIFGKYIYLFGGDYWVIDLEPNYHYAVVGHPTRQYGWILARQTSLSDQDLKQIAQRLVDQGYDTCAFLTSIQEGGFTTQQPLCEYLKGR